MKVLCSWEVLVYFKNRAIKAKICLQLLNMSWIFINKYKKARFIVARKTNVYRFIQVGLVTLSGIYETR